MKNRNKYIATISYIVLIVFINMAFSFTPIYHLWGCEISPFDPLAGVVYLVRDFAQRELGHGIFVAMIVGCVLSFFMSSAMVATASVMAFAIGELLDWGIFTFSKKPLSQRLMWSASLSAPIDSLVFLYMIHRANPLAVIIMTIGKVIGIGILWLVWRARAQRATVKVSSSVKGCVSR